MIKVIQGDVTLADNRLHPWQRFMECIMTGMDSGTDQLPFSCSQRLRDIGVQAPASTEIANPAFRALPAYSNAIEVQRMRPGDIPDVILGHPDHDGVGTYISIRHDAIVGIPGPAPEPAGFP